MKKILLTISFLLFASCTEYTVKVEADDVIINDDNVENGDCVTYTKAFFGWFGDPLTVKVGEEETSYEEGNYVVGEEIKEVEEACEKNNTSSDEDLEQKLEVAKTEKKEADEALAQAKKEKKEADEKLRVAINRGARRAYNSKEVATAKEVVDVATKKVANAQKVANAAKEKVATLTKKVADAEQQ